MCGRMEHSEWTSTQGGLIVDAKSLKRFTFDIKTGMVLHASGERVGKPVVGRVLIDGTFYTRAQVAYMLHYGETVTRIAFADKNNRNLRPGNLIPISIVSVGSSSTVKVTVRKSNATTFLGYHCSMHACSRGRGAHLLGHSQDPYTSRKGSAMGDSTIRITAKKPKRSAAQRARTACIVGAAAVGYITLACALVATTAYYGQGGPLVDAIYATYRAITLP